MIRLSDWYRNGLQWLMAHVSSVGSAKGKQKLYTATAHCRVSYIDALHDEVGQQRAMEILKRESLGNAKLKVIGGTDGPTDSRPD